MVSLYLAMWPIGTGGTENAATNPLVDLHWVLTLSTILFALTGPAIPWGWAPGGLVWSATPGCADAADAVLTDERAQTMY